MKKLLIILLCLPLFLFSQEEKTYAKTMSVSQFAKELKQAADKGIGYTLKDCYITYDSIRDKNHITAHAPFDEDPIRFHGDMIIRDIFFQDTTQVIIENCRFGNYGHDPLEGVNYSPTITFDNCNFGKLEMQSINVHSTYIKSSKLIDLYYDFGISSDYSGININKSNIDRILLHGECNIVDQSAGYGIFLSENTIKYCNINIQKSAIAVISRNTINTLDFGSSNGGRYPPYDHLQINNNTFITNPIVFQNAYGYQWAYIKLDNNNQIYGEIGNQYTLFIEDLIIKSFWFQENTFGYEKVNNDIIFNSINDIDILGWGGLKDSTLQIRSLDYTGKKQYDDSLNKEEKHSFFNQYFKENQIQFRDRNEQIIIRNIQCDRFLANDIQSNSINMNRNQFNVEFTLKNFEIDSLSIFSNNTLPDYNRVSLDKTILNNLGFKLNNKVCLGNEEFRDIDTANLKDYNQSVKALTSQYRQFINILNQKGDGLKVHFIMKLKDIQTNQKMFEYYEDPNIERWFNWKGSEFLKWYSDYGMNPFKALSYCFKAMLWFALFYFFFYSDWDKIDRRFLIKRFNNVIDYFTSEKRIQDFYSSTHDKEMTTFTEFKKTLDKNKVHMPSMLASLAKPIYQISFLRYKLLNFSYKRAEFMAGRKWVDLKKKDRYLIGTLTFFLTIFYIIYLIIVRALNSIVLSINAFSTLGFGQIPVRGFTKYVAIIEGFIGWFLLSVFIVSLLSQMMSV